MLAEPPPSERPWQKTRFRAPRADDSHIAIPPLSEAAQLARSNKAALQSVDRCLQGRSLSQLREWSRREIYRAAESYTRELLGADAASHLCGPDLENCPQAPWYVSGHQPILFHPGVWVKNFVTAKLASSCGIGINLVVDNDTLSATSIRVPAGSAESPRIELVPFDDPRPTQPWEEVRILNRDLFRSFPDRVESALADRNLRPMLHEFWQVAVQHAEKNDRLSDVLTAARATTERRWGAGNLELPLSRLCRLDPYLWFSSHILAHLPRFHAIYNEVLGEYRAVNGIRSRRHPVPDLAIRENWFEAPFWIWRAGDRIRRRLFARQEERDVLLSDGAETIGRLPISPEREACCAVEALREMQEAGWRFRTRALTTTLFSRLCLADLFLHGLGGAKYDEMTDRLISRFFSLPVPDFLMLSGTVRLPMESHPVDEGDVQRLRRQLRELEFHSERYLPLSRVDDTRELVEEKQRLVAFQQVVSARRRGESVHWNAGEAPEGYDRFRRLQDVNRSLSRFTQREREDLLMELTRTQSQLAANGILRDREYAFCLFPAEKLQRFMNDVCSAVGT